MSTSSLSSTQPIRSGVFEVIPVLGLPEFTPGMAVFPHVLAAFGTENFEDGDIIVISSKIISKSEGRFCPLSVEEEKLNAETERIVAHMPSPTASPIVQSRLGIVAASAGIDKSNVPEGQLLLLPKDPDNSARQIVIEAFKLTQKTVGVIITDTVGRAWRLGQTDIAIGSSGVQVFSDERGKTDNHGNVLTVTQRCIADEVAAAADLVKGKVNAVPVAIIKGLSHLVDKRHRDTARDIVRPLEQDLFSLGTAEAMRLGYQRAREELQSDD